MAGPTDSETGGDHTGWCGHERSPCKRVLEVVAAKAYRFLDTGQVLPQARRSTAFLHLG